MSQDKDLKYEEQNFKSSKGTVLYILKFIFIVLGVIFAVHLLAFFIMYSIKGAEVWDVYKNTWEWYKELLKI